MWVFVASYYEYSWEHLGELEQAIVVASYSYEGEILKTYLANFP
jgi:hypothetical protein